MQLYARSGQLPTADGLLHKNKQTSNLCRLGCRDIEDEHHIFSDCPAFETYRNEAIRQVDADPSKLLEKETKLEESESKELMGMAKSLFNDNSIMAIETYSILFRAHPTSEPSSTKPELEYSGERPTATQHSKHMAFGGDPACGKNMG